MPAELIGFTLVLGTFKLNSCWAPAAARSAGDCSFVTWCCGNFAGLFLILVPFGNYQIWDVQSSSQPKHVGWGNRAVESLQLCHNNNFKFGYFIITSLENGHTVAHQLWMLISPFCLKYHHWINLNFVCLVHYSKSCPITIQYNYNSFSLLWWQLYLSAWLYHSWGEFADYI